MIVQLDISIFRLSVITVISWFAKGHHIKQCLFLFSSSSQEREAFASELASVQTLRLQLKDSIKHNSQLGKQLERQIKKTAHKQDSGMHIVN